MNNGYPELLKTLLPAKTLMSGLRQRKMSTTRKKKIRLGIWQTLTCMDLNSLVKWWNLKVDEMLRRISFTSCESEPCLCMKKGSITNIIAVYGLMVCCLDLGELKHVIYNHSRLLIRGRYTNLLVWVLTSLVNWSIYYKSAWGKQAADFSGIEYQRECSSWPSNINIKYSKTCITKRNFYYI